MGLKDQISGITKFCVHPQELRKETKVVGGTKQVHFDKIEALSPDIIICNKEENTREMVEQLDTIAPVWVSDIQNVEDSFEMIKVFGTIFNVSEKASEIAARIISKKNDFSEFIKNKPSKKVAYLIWKNPYMAAATNTFINTLLELNHFENVISDVGGRYPEVGSNALKEAETVLLSSEPYPFKKTDVTELENRLQKEVRLVDGEYFSWYGSRLLYAFDYFKGLH